MKTVVESKLLELLEAGNPIYTKIDNKLVQITLVDAPLNEVYAPVKQNTTIVTAMWNLGRDNLSDDFKRPYSQYLEKFAELLKTPSNLYIYVSKEDEEFVWKHRSCINTIVNIKEIEEFKRWFPFYDKVQELRVNDDWRNQAGWLLNSPQTNLEYYNPLVMSKMFLLNDASIHNPFDSEYFYWIDGGITNTVHSGYFWHDRVFDNLAKYTESINKFLFISYPYEGGEEIHGFPRKEIARYCNTGYVNYVCRGGFFGGKKEHIHEMNGLYYATLQNTLNSNFMGTEESIFTILAHTQEELIHRFEIESNGLIWPFFEKLKSIDELVATTVQKLKTKKSPKNAKVNLYVLGFNSPRQFEKLCESIQQCDSALMSRTTKYLINNSTQEELFDEYDQLCAKYNFQEIHKENLGVCGGRQFIAEHFDQTDGDFYLFFEDDMMLNDNTATDSCKSGFKKYVPRLFENIVKIMFDQKLDFLKLSFSEFYGENSVQWAWYNVPQEIRSRDWPHYDKLPEHGLDPYAPKTKLEHIYFTSDVAYITGEIYYSNWPQIVSKEGNKKMFLDTTWAHPFEQTWMSHMYQLTKHNKLKPGLLLASPVTHDRFDHYAGSLRKES